MIPAHRQNLLLRALDPCDRALIWPKLERVSLKDGQSIVAKGETIACAYFPEGGVITVAEVLSDQTRVEVALIGREGMTGSQLLLGCEQASHEAYVRIGGGTALRLAADDLRILCARSPAAHNLFLRFIHTVATQSTRTLASNAVHPIVKRLARWLLMCHDRIDSSEIILSHDSISRMLSVRRATVTEAIQCLEGQLALKNTRGRIVIRDRPKLEEIAGDAYENPTRIYRGAAPDFGEAAEHRQAAAR